MSYLDYEPDDRSFVLGVLCGAVAAKKRTILDPYGDVAVALSPQQLAQLERRLTPAEQRIVDDFQIAQADAAQAAEERRVYTDPVTGQRRTALATYDTKPAATEGWLSRRSWGVPHWGWIGLAASGLAIAVSVAVSVSRR